MTAFDFESLYRFDDQCRDGLTRLCGIDEAGRGPLAGPVFAAAVVLKPETRFNFLRDSKKITAKRREALFDQITEQALDYGIGAASVEEIDRLNILQATYLAMERAAAALKQIPERILVDGNRMPPNLPCEAFTQIKGDDTSASIAAAAVLAKVSRDRYMTRLDEKYPEYGFARHKGYGTAYHYEQIRANGISPVHRRSFLKKEIASGVPIL